ncbi:MAG: metallophosphoesterase [Gaiellaceae bacterium]
MLGRTLFRRSQNAPCGYTPTVTATIRVAAAGDIHAGESLRERLRRAFAEIGQEADLVLLAGDLTTHGLPEQPRCLPMPAGGCRSRSLQCLEITTTTPASARRSAGHSGRRARPSWNGVT